MTGTISPQAFRCDRTGHDRAAKRSRAQFRTYALCSAAVIATALSSGYTQAADVDITTDTATVNLDSFTGTTARVFPNVTVSNGISATTQAWSLTNDGTVNGSNTVNFTVGGGVINNAGAAITGSLTAVRLGTTSAGPGTFENFGTVTGGIGEGVSLFFGGTVTNHAGATISTATGLNAVSIGQGTSRTLQNSGTISATRTTGFSTGVLMQGGPRPSPIPVPARSMATSTAFSAAPPQSSPASTTRAQSTRRVVQPSKRPAAAPSSIPARSARQTRTAS